MSAAPINQILNPFIIPSNHSISAAAASTVTAQMVGLAVPPPQAAPLPSAPSMESDSKLSSPLIAWSNADIHFEAPAGTPASISLSAVDVAVSNPYTWITLLFDSLLPIEQCRHALALALLEWPQFGGRYHRTGERSFEIDLVIQ